MRAGTRACICVCVCVRVRVRVRMCVCVVVFVSQGKRQKGECAILIKTVPECVTMEEEHASKAAPEATGEQP